MKVLGFIVRDSSGTPYGSAARTREELVEFCKEQNHLANQHGVRADFFISNDVFIEV